MIIMGFSRTGHALYVIFYIDKGTRIFYSIVAFFQ